MLHVGFSKPSGDEDAEEDVSKARGRGSSSVQIVWGMRDEGLTPDVVSIEPCTRVRAAHSAQRRAPYRV